MQINHPIADARLTAQESSWRIVGILVFSVSGILLLSMGGAIIAAPITLPMMFLTSRRHPTGGFCIAATVLGALTVVESVWALTFFQLSEAKPWIWLLPAVGGIAAGLMFANVRRSSERVPGKLPPGASR